MYMHTHISKMDENTGDVGKSREKQKREISEKKGVNWEKSRNTRMGAVWV